MKKPQFITKRCERCEKLFNIQNVSQSYSRELVLQYTPCSHCFYIPNPKNPKYNRSGRCLDCSIPFTMVNHKAKGRCHRCLMAHYRRQGSTKTA